MVDIQRDLLTGEHFREYRPTNAPVKSGVSEPKSKNSIPSSSGELVWNASDDKVVFSALPESGIAVDDDDDVDDATRLRLETMRLERERELELKRQQIEIDDDTGVGKWSSVNVVTTENTFSEIVATPVDHEISMKRKSTHSNQTVLNLSDDEDDMRSHSRYQHDSEAEVNDIWSAQFGHSALVLKKQRVDQLEQQMDALRSLENALSGGAKTEDENAPISFQSKRKKVVARKTQVVDVSSDDE